MKYQMLCSEIKVKRYILKMSSANFFYPSCLALRPNDEHGCYDFFSLFTYS